MPAKPSIQVRSRRSWRAASQLPTESQNPARAKELDDYVRRLMAPELERLGFTCKILTVEGAKGPFLIAERIEDPSLVTVLGYGHGDTVLGMEGRWIDNLNPFELTERDGKWYGRGVVDNKGQHSINLAALEAVLQGARQARLQRALSHRDGRGDRFSGPCEARARAWRSPRRRRADRLRRADAFTANGRTFRSARAARSISIL